MVRALALCMLFGCSETSGITLGAIISVTGGRAQVGSGELQSIQMAIDEIKAAGGVNGSPLVMFNVDDRSTTDGATAGAQEMVMRKVPAILGTTSTDTMVAASALTIPANIVMISDLASGPTLVTASSGNDTLFTTAAQRIPQGQILAERALAKGQRKAALILAPVALDSELGSGFVSKFTAGGGTIVQNVTITQGLSSYTSVLQQIYTAGTPDCIVLGVYPPEGIQIIKDYLASFASKSTFWFFTSQLGNPDFPTGVGSSNFTFGNEGIDTADGPNMGAFAANYAAKYPGSSIEPEPGAYDDLYVLALAMQAAGKNDSQSIKDNIRNVSNPPGMIVGPGQFAEAMTALKAGRKVNYEGASGSCDFDATGAAPTVNLIWGIVGGQYQVLVPAISP